MNSIIQIRIWGALLWSTSNWHGYMVYIAIHVTYVGDRGYIEFVKELQGQLEGGKVSGIKHFDDIVMACGRWVLLESQWSQEVIGFGSVSFFCTFFFIFIMVIFLLKWILRSLFSTSENMSCLQWRYDSRACIGCSFEQPSNKGVFCLVEYSPSLV